MNELQTAIFELCSGFAVDQLVSPNLVTQRKVARILKMTASQNGTDRTKEAEPCLQRIADSLQRIADHFDPEPPDVVDTTFIARRLVCTTTWISELVRRGEIPVTCIVPGTGNGKPWKFYRAKIEQWLENR